MSINYKEIEQYTKQQSAFMHEWLMSYDYSQVRMFNTRKNKLVITPDLNRRANDWIAAAYVHAVALDQGSGDDCIDARGNFYELKLAYVDADQIHFGPQSSALLHGAGNTSFNHAYNAKYRVHPGTSTHHHNQDTAFILMSKQHNCYITGFMMHGNTIQNILMNGGQTTINRSVSLSQFIRHGYEIQSSVPHIGWDRYYTALTQYVMARERKITGSAAKTAIRNWVDFANPNNLQRLVK